MGKRIIEVWVTRNGDLITVEQNPCLCCPDSYIKQWGNRFKESGSYVGKKKARRKMMRENYCERLGDL